MAETYYEWTLQREEVRCGKAGCSACPHGWYWYGYRRDGKRTKKKYFGRRKPTEGRFVAPCYRTPTVVQLAKVMRETSNLDLAPILADALEDVGYHEPKVLEYLRRGHTNDATVCDLLRSILVDSTVPVFTPHDQ